MTTTEPDVIPTHVTSVVRHERLSERFVRVTFGGGLDRFAPVGPDQFVYLLLPPPGRPDLTIGVDFRWSEYDAMPVEERPVGAYYTVRAHRPAAGELDCDVFLHDPAGAASAWAAVSERGRPAALWGPRTAWAPPDGTRRWLLVVDETGVPAAEAVLDALPDGADARVLVELSDPGVVAHAQRHRAFTLVRRGTDVAAGRSDVLVDAVRALDLDPDGLYAWGGAESRAMRDVRRHLRTVVGLHRDQVSMTPYWRHAAHGDVVVDDEVDRSVS